jgi:protein associated with RNAse G/E
MTDSHHLRVRALRADGTCYRSWTTELVYQDALGVVTFAVPGGVVDDRGQQWVKQHATRAVYWFDRPYNLLEVFTPEGTLVELYVHIASPARLVDSVLEYTDHELDVVLTPGEKPRVVDEEEFAAASMTYGYTADFQQGCWAACRRAEYLVSHWSTGAPPVAALRTVDGPLLSNLHTE